MWRYAPHPGKYCKYRILEKVLPCSATRYASENIVNTRIMKKCCCVARLATPCENQKKSKKNLGNWLVLRVFFRPKFGLLVFFIPPENVVFSMVFMVYASIFLSPGYAKDYGKVLS